MGGGSADLPRTDDGRLPKLLHHHRPRQPIGAREHGGVHRTARGVGERLPASHARARTRRGRAHRGSGGGLGPARQRLRGPHAVSAGTLVVHGRQRAGQATRVSALHRRGRHATARCATRWSARIISGFGSTVRVARAATTASSAGCNQTSRSCSMSSPASGCRRWIRSTPKAPARCPVRSPQHGRPVRQSPKPSMACCPARPAISPTVCSGRPARDRIRWWSTTTAAAGCSAAPTLTIRSAAISACAPMPSSSPLTTATRRRRASPRPLTMRSPPSSGSRDTPSRSEERLASWQCAGGVPARTLPPSCASSRATPADRTSTAKCW